MSIYPDLATAEHIEIHRFIRLSRCITPPMESSECQKSQIGHELVCLPFPDHQDVSIEIMHLDLADPVLTTDHGFGKQFFC